MPQGPKVPQQRAVWVGGPWAASGAAALPAGLRGGAGALLGVQVRWRQQRSLHPPAGAFSHEEQHASSIKPDTSARAACWWAGSGACRGSRHAEIGAAVCAALSSWTLRLSPAAMLSAQTSSSAVPINAYGQQPLPRGCAR